MMHTLSGIRAAGRQCLDGLCLPADAERVVNDELGDDRFARAARRVASVIVQGEEGKRETDRVEDIIL